MKGSTGESEGPGRYRFGDFVVVEAAHVLLRGSEPQPLEPKAFAVLLALLRHPGELLARDELLDRVWGHRHVTPGVLTRAIAQLRAALGDDPQDPRYIQTRHALGYSFIGELLPEPQAEDAGTAAQPAPATVAETDMPSVRVEEAAPDPEAVPGQAVAQERRHGPRHAFAWRPRHWLLASLLAAAVFALSVWSVRQGVRKPVEASIAVLPFSNLGSHPADDYFAEGLAVEMHDALAGVRGLRVAAQLVPAATASREADVGAVGRRLGVATVLDASVRRDGERVRISARLSDAATGFTLWSRSYDREMQDVFATQSEIANEVLGALLEVLPAEREALDRRLAPTKSTVAFDAYLKGLSSLALGKSEEALGQFGAALENDSGFARAQAGVCRAEIARFEYMRSADAFENARLACRRAETMDPTMPAVKLALGDLHRVRGEHAQAIAFYAGALDAPSARASALVGLGAAHAEQGQPARAMSYFRQAIEERPANVRAYVEMSYQQYLSGAYDDAIASLRKAIVFKPEDALYWATLGGYNVVAGHHADARKALERSVEIEPNYAALGNLATLKYHAGDHAGAAADYRAAIALDPGDFYLWGYLGDALIARSGTRAEAATAFREASERVERYLAIKPGDAKALAALAWYSANLGARGRALALVRRSESVGGSEGDVALFNAQTFSLLGEVGEAQQRVARARAHGVPDALITTNVVLRDMERGARRTSIDVSDTAQAREHTGE